MSLYKYIFIAFLFASCQLGFGQLIPEGYSVTDYPIDYDQPVGIHFDDEDKMYVWEKKGRIWIEKDGVKNNQPLLDIKAEVGNYTDLGLLGFALHPDFYNNGYFYVYYFLDLNYYDYFGTDDYSESNNDNEHASIMRLTRYTADPTKDYEEIIPGSRKILIGENLENGIPVLHSSHTGGAILFGSDGTLLVSTGDGSTFEAFYGGGGPPFLGEKVEEGLQRNIIDEKEEVGCYRPQILDNLNGKILRINPDTGKGVSSNPFFDPENPNADRSKVWVLGLRNPFSVNLRPNTGSTNPDDALPGTLYIGDVGSSKSEELNIVRTGGKNFGWPVYEGFKRNNSSESWSQINQYHENPLNGESGCNQYFKFSDLIKNYQFGQINFPNPCDNSKEIDDEITYYHEFPEMAYHHLDIGGGMETFVLNSDGEKIPTSYKDANSPIQTSIEDWAGNCIISGGFVDSELWSQEYKGAYFMSDYDHTWVRYAFFDDNDNLLSIEPFYQDSMFPIHYIKYNEKDGCLYVSSIEHGLRKICYEGNVPPIAKYNIDQYYGPSPLTVNIDANESYDPDGDEFYFRWIFEGDTINTGPEFSYEFEGQNNEPAKYTVTLFLRDTVGKTTSEEIEIWTDNSPPEVSIVGLENNSLYSIAGINQFDLQSQVADSEHEQDQLEYQWTSILKHNNHQHSENAGSDTGLTWTLAPIGCDGEKYNYQIVLTVTDPLGLTGTDQVEVFPNCDNPFFELISFYGSPGDNQVELNWEVNDLDGIDYFELYTQYNDQPLTKVDDIDAEFGESFYQSIHTLTSIPDLISYKLKIVSSEGVEVWSEPIFFDKNEIRKSSSFFSPQPATNQLFVNFYGVLSSATLRIYNSIGQEVMEQDYNLVLKKQYEIDITEWMRGVYYYQIESGEYIESGSILVVK